MGLVKVTARFSYQHGWPAKVRLSVKLTHPDVDSDGFYAPCEQIFESAANGHVVMDLWPNARGSTGSKYRFKVTDAEHGAKLLDIEGLVPDMDCYLSDIADMPLPASKPIGQLAVDSARLAAAEATSERDSITRLIDDFPVSEVRLVPEALDVGREVIRLSSVIQGQGEKVEGYHSEVARQEGEIRRMLSDSHGYMERSESAADSVKGYIDQAKAAVDGVRNAAIAPMVVMACSMMDVQALMLKNDNDCERC